MRLPENGRLFVRRISPSTGDADLRSHFRRFGEVTDVCLPKDRITGRPRCFAFVQFSRPIDAARALADPHHVINGCQVHVAKAEPKGSSSTLILHDRVFRSGNKVYRVGDMIRLTIGPMSDNCEENEYVNQVRKYGVIVDKTLIFNCIIGYISRDGKEYLVRWPPVQGDDKSCQGSIIPAYANGLKALAQLSTGNIATDGESSDVRPHNWCWLVMMRP